jgi:tetratricopeptide (TPR) repeat protein
MTQCKIGFLYVLIVPLTRTDRVKSKSLHYPIKFGAAALLVALAGIFPAPSHAAEVRPRDPHMGTRMRTPETEIIRLRPGQLPYVNLTGELFYRILASELAAQRGLLGPAAGNMLALAQDTSDPRLARRSLEFALSSGNLVGALEAARLWVRLAPYDAEAGNTELALAAANGQTEGLSLALRKRIETAKDKTAAIAQAVGIVSRLNDRRIALKILDESFSPQVRKLAVARLALSDAAQAAGDSPRAVQEARAALAADPKSEEAAQRLLEYGAKVDQPRALAEARAFTQHHPEARKLRLMLVSQLADRGDFDGALTDLQQMTRQSPEDFDLLFMQSQLAYKAGRLDQSRNLLNQYLEVQQQRQRAIRAGSTDAGAAVADAHVLLARIAEDQQRYDDAIGELGRIDDPTLRYSARLRQAAIRAKQGRVDEALTMVDKAAPDGDDERVMGILAKAQILRDADRIDQAVALLAAADKSNPDTVEVKYELAMLYERQGHIDQLEKLLRQVIVLDPDHAHAYNALGYTLADNNQRLPEAQTLIQRALDLSPDDPFILDSMGWVKYRMGDNAAAISFLRRAYAQRPEAEIASHLAEVLWVAGQKDEARKLFQQAAAKDPGSKALQETVKRLGASQ